MAFCRNCGSQIDDRATVCPRCGASQNGGTYYSGGGMPPQNSYDRGGFGWGLLGFCIPIVGLILFLVWRDQKPLTAKAAGMGALIWLCVTVVFYVLAIVVGVGSSLMYY